MRFALHQFNDYASTPTKFSANDGWLYNQRRTKFDHFEIDLENNCSTPKIDIIKRDKAFYGQAHRNFKKAWFSSNDLFDVKKEDLESLIISHFDGLLERCIAEETFLGSSAAS
jgi:hypothetical protein